MSARCCAVRQGWTMQAGKSSRGPCDTRGLTIDHARTREGRRPGHRALRADLRNRYWWPCENRIIRPQSQKRSAELYAIVNGCYVYAFSQLQQLRWSVTQWLQSAKNGACSHIIIIIIIIISPHLHLCPADSREKSP